LTIFLAALAQVLAVFPLWIAFPSEAGAQSCVSRPEPGLWSGTWSSTKITGEHGTFSGYLRFAKKVAPYSVTGVITVVDPGLLSFSSATNGTITCTGGWSVPITTPVGVESYTGSESGGTSASGTFAAPSINDAGTWSAGVMPVVTKVSPQHGPTAGERTVKIKGSGLEFGVVDFGGHPATVVSANPKFSVITVTSPPGTGTVDVTVTTPNGTSAKSPADLYTFK
jgi:hypothetical protein